MHTLIGWNKSYWFGHGDEVYAYDYEEFTEALTHLHLGNEDEEPYHSIVDERYKMEYVFQYCESDTMINVLSYFYGRWVWLIYSLMAFCSVTLAATLLPFAGRLPSKLMFLTAWILFGVITILPALNGCALIFDPVAGVLFTGIGQYYSLYGALFAGPAIGVILGLVYRKTEIQKETNPDAVSSADKGDMPAVIDEMVNPVADEIE